MILDRAGTSKEICDSKRVRSFFGELAGSAVSGVGGLLCSWVSPEQPEQFSLNSRTPHMQSSAGCPGGVLSLRHGSISSSFRLVRSADCSPDNPGQFSPAHQAGQNAPPGTRADGPGSKRHCPS